MQNPISFHNKKDGRPTRCSISYLTFLKNVDSLKPVHSDSRKKGKEKKNHSNHIHIILKNNDNEIGSNRL